MPQLPTFEYYWEAPLNGQPVKRHKKVKLHTYKGVDLAFLNGLGRGSSFAYRCTQRLENQPPDSDDGTWPISFWRTERMYGGVGPAHFSDHDVLADASPETWERAALARLFCYYRVPTLDLAIRHVAKTCDVRLSLEISSDWYDPVNGELPIISPNDEFVASHAIPLEKYLHDSEVFRFPNSWGEWGDNGYGYFPTANWDASIIDAWHTFARCMYLRSTNEVDAEVFVRGWKLRCAGVGVHGREIMDRRSNAPIAWAFCVDRGRQILELDEFFVAPEFRGNGYASELARLVLTLQHVLKCPLRQIVSFADVEPDLSGPTAVARLLNLHLSRSALRWAPYVGNAVHANDASTTWKPKRPASILEKLRPKTETPTDPVQYVVFYGTNRQPVDTAKHSKGFANQRNNELSLGKAIVELPATHRFGSVGRNWLSFWKPPKSDDRRIVLIEGLGSDDFLGLAGSLMTQASDEPSNLLYIHGFRNSFDDALLYGAQLGCDLKIPGTTFVFSWPSNQTIAKYNHDEANVAASLPYLEEYILLLLKNFPDFPLHIVAHSMGNRVLLGLFQRLAAAGELPGTLGQFIFAAADVDSDEFCGVVNSTKPIAKRMSVYSSRADVALQASEILHGYQRVGLAPPLTLTAHTDTILVEGFDLFNAHDKFAHEYFVKSAAVMHDMFVLIRYDSPPSDRQGLQEMQNADGVFWRLPLP